MGGDRFITANEISNRYLDVGASYGKARATVALRENNFRFSYSTRHGRRDAAAPAAGEGGGVATTVGDGAHAQNTPSRAAECLKDVGWDASSAHARAESSGITGDPEQAFQAPVRCSERSAADDTGAGAPRREESERADVAQAPGGGTASPEAPVGMERAPILSGLSPSHHLSCLSHFRGVRASR
jgi:hypothetical protein